MQIHSPGGATKLLGRLQHNHFHHQARFDNMQQVHEDQDERDRISLLTHRKSSDIQRSESSRRS